MKLSGKERYLNAKNVIENPSRFHVRVVSKAENYCEGYENGASEIKKEVYKAEEYLSHLFPLEADKYIRMRKEFIKRYKRVVTNEH